MSWPSDSVGSFIEYLAPGVLSRDRCPAWPPDVFAITASVLRQTGSYSRVLDLSGPLLGAGWPEKARSIGRRWRSSLNRELASKEAEVTEWTWRRLEGQSSDEEDPLEGTRIPREVVKAWRLLLSHAGCSLAGACADDDLCRALLALSILADEASAGLGIQTEKTDEFLDYANMVLPMLNDARSACRLVSCEKAQVLPKQHTSQRGLTVRSLTHHLALCPANEVEVRWYSNFHLPEVEDLDVLNLLLLPWPLELAPKNFECREYDAQELPPSYRFFSFCPRGTGRSAEEFLKDALATAKQHFARIDGIVFPELALSYQECRRIERIALRERALLIAGVYASEDDGFPGPTNSCFVQPAGLTSVREKDLMDWMRIVQHKHHRWCLDRRQIMQYGLGGVLPASKDCWERMHVDDRTLNLVTLGPWLTIGVLICEDLARQDPVSEILRTVGPNLVVALLMDGPQIRQRWPAKYASILAEDPGTSVLTLTSLGMSTMSKPPAKGEDRSRVIALWRDVEYGEQEIELPEGDDACVLSLVYESLEEHTADGRGDGGVAHFPVFAGVRTFAVPRTRPPGPKREKRKG